MSKIIKQINMASLDKIILNSKFRGCLLGSLLGDCLGAPFEGDVISPGEKIVIQRYFDKLEDPKFKGPYRKYTDDTAMTKSVCKFLIDKPEPDYKFLARLFVKEFFSEPDRGYGQNVMDVFDKLKNTKFQDVFKPALEQFNGSGSFGNGGAMRIAPIALYFHQNIDTMLEVAKNATKITHTNILGINGALLQCLAIQQALLIHPQDKISPTIFCEDLIDKMRDIEIAADDDGVSGTPYKEKLRIVQYLSTKKYNDELDDEVILTLGNSISAFDSVPTAIYCFLRALKEIPMIETSNVFRRTIQYAVTLGGDTDTIASMAGAIAGAYLGEDAVNTCMAKHCELYKEVIEMADNLKIARADSSDSDD